MEIVAHLTHKAAMMLKKYKLHEVATFELSNVDKKSKEGERSVRLCNFTDVYYNWAVTRNMEQSFMLATASESQIKKLAIRKGQVAITKDSETRHDIGIPTYIADDFDNTVLGYHCALITPDQSKVDVRFLNAFLNSKMAKEYFANNASGSGMRYSLPVDAIKNILLYLPELEEQKRIGHLLSLIDRKIALNREINRNLEAVARQLYDYWFVQFDFPDSEGKPYKSSGGKMVWNDILKREIPDGWEAAQLNNWLEIKSGFPFKSESYTTFGRYKIITIKNVQDGELITSDCEFVDNVPSRVKDYVYLKIGDRLISLTGNCGRLCVVCEDNLLLNQRVGLLYCEDLHLEYCYNLLNSNCMKMEIDNLANGAAQANLSPIELCKANCVMPPKAILIEYAKSADTIRKTIIRNSQEISQLTKQRDELLPLLMNGQVSVMRRAVNCDLAFMYRPVESSCRMIRQGGADGEGRYVANNA